MARVQHFFLKNVKQIEKLRHLNAFVTENIKAATENLSVSMERHEQGQRKGPLDGVTFSVKDNICTEGIRTTCGSKFLEDYVSPFTATAVEKLLHNGSVMVGKTNMDEFGMGGASLNSYFGQVYHPKSNPTEESWLVSGGSSGGSAVTVATDMCTYSLGSDTGGSVRIPASFCGVVGIKPTYGRVSRFGLVPYASSMDTIGVFSKDVSILAEVLDVISGWDPRDLTTARISHVACSDKLNDFKPGIRIGLLKDFTNPLKCSEYKDVVSKSVACLQQHGTVVEEVAMSEVFKCVTAYYMLCAAEASSNMAKYSGMIYGHRSSMPSSTAAEMVHHTQMEGLGEVVRKRINVGKYFLSQEGREQYDNANEVRQRIMSQFEEAFKRFDLILTPTTIGPALSVEEYKALDPLESDAYDTFTCPANMCGLPAISVPFGETQDKKLPLGVQLIANHFQEHKLLQAARVLQHQRKQS